MPDVNTIGDLKPSAAVRNISTPDGAVLLDIGQGLCFSMNPVGSKIWELLKQNHSTEYIADVLANEFSVTREQVLKDITEFVAQLQDQHLLVSTRETPKRQDGLFHRFFHRIHPSN